MSAWHVAGIPRDIPLSIIRNLQREVQGELDRVSQALAGRIRELAERYAMPLPKLADEVARLSARVAEHLRKMGAVWN